MTFENMRIDALMYWRLETIIHLEERLFLPAFSFNHLAFTNVILKLVFSEPRNLIVLAGMYVYINMNYICTLLDTFHSLPIIWHRYIVPLKRQLWIMKIRYKGYHLLLDALLEFSKAFISKRWINPFKKHIKVKTNHSTLLQDTV